MKHDLMMGSSLLFAHGESPGTWQSLYRILYLRCKWHDGPSIYTLIFKAKKGRARLNTSTWFVLNINPIRRLYHAAEETAKGPGNGQLSKSTKPCHLERKSAFAGWLSLFSERLYA